MSDLSRAAADVLGIPQALVERAAEARATAAGISVEEVLTAWGSGGEVSSAPTPEPAVQKASEADSPPPASEPEADEVAEQPEQEPSQPSMEQPAVSGMVTRMTPSREVTPSEAANLPEVITVPTAGIRERTNFVMPRWLVAVLMIVPAFALFTLGGSATGTCGEATELRTDVVTGDIINCDGSEFTGSGVGGGATDFIGEGQAVYLGTGAAGVNCSGCHGPSGGGGVGPALTGVVSTFGSCADHELWVRIGSAGFQGQGKTTYGDTNKPIASGMPAHASLTDQQLASVTAFERVRFGGADVDATLVDCGLAEPAADDGSDATDGTSGATDQGTGDPSTATTAAP